MVTRFLKDRIVIWLFFDKNRQLWHYYLENNDAVIFVVDSTDHERLPEVKEELHDLMNDDRLRNACLLVLANKQDLPGALTASQLTEALGLRDIKGHDWYIQACCAVSGEGLVDGLSWLAPKVKEAKRSSS